MKLLERIDGDELVDPRELWEVGIFNVLIAKEKRFSYLYITQDREECTLSVFDRIHGLYPEESSLVPSVGCELIQIESAKTIDLLDDISKLDI